MPVSGQNGVQFSGFLRMIARAEDNWGLHRHQFSKGIDRFIRA
jgi:hypothetical protein